MVNLLRVIECHVVQREVICDRGFLLDNVADPYYHVRLGRNVWAKITVLSDFTLVIENTIIKHLLVISFVLLRFNLRISAPFYQHHGLKDPHLLLSIVLIVHAFALMIELLIHGVIPAARPYHALIV